MWCSLGFMAADLEAAEVKLGVDLGALSAGMAAAPRDSRSSSSGQSSAVSAMASFLGNDGNNSENLELDGDGGSDEGPAKDSAKSNETNHRDGGDMEEEGTGEEAEASNELGGGVGGGDDASSGGGDRRASKRARRSEVSPMTKEATVARGSGIPYASLGPPKPRRRPLLLPNLTVDTSRGKTASRLSAGLMRSSRNSSSNSAIGLGAERIQRTSSGDLWNAEFAEMGDMAWMGEPASGGESSGGSSLESNQPGSGGSGVDSASGMGGGGLASSLSRSSPGGNDNVAKKAQSSGSGSLKNNESSSKGSGVNSVVSTTLSSSEIRVLEPTSAQITFEVLRSMQPAAKRDVGEEPATPELIDAIRGATGGGVIGKEPHSATNLILTSSSSSRSPEALLERQRQRRSGKQLTVSMDASSDNEGGDGENGAENEPSSTDQDSPAEGAPIEEEDLDDEDGDVIDESFALAVRDTPLSVLCFSRALLFNPHNVPALIALGRVAMHQQQWRLAAERLKRVVDIDCVVTEEKPATASRAATPTGASAGLASAFSSASTAAAPQVVVKKAAVAALAAAESLAAAQAEGPARVRARATAAAKNQAAVAAAAVVTAAAAAAAAATDSGSSNSGSSSSRSRVGVNASKPEAMTRIVSRSGLVGTTVWRDLGFCLLRSEDLPKACRAYAHALALHRQHALATSSSSSQDHGSGGGGSGSDRIMAMNSDSSVVAKLEALGGSELANELTALAGQWGKEGYQWPSDSELWFGLGLLLSRLGASVAAADCLRACALLLSGSLGEGSCSGSTDFISGSVGASSSLRSHRSTFARLATCRLKLATLLRCSAAATKSSGGSLSSTTVDASDANAAAEAALASFAADLDAATAAATAVASDARTDSTTACGLPVAVPASRQQPSNGTFLGVPALAWTGSLLSAPSSSGESESDECDSASSSSSGVPNTRPLVLLQAQVAVERGHCFEASRAWEQAQEQYELALRYSTGGGGGSDGSGEVTGPQADGQQAAPQLLQQLGWLLFSKRGDLRRGVALLEEATRHPQGKQDWRSWYLLGRLYMVQAAAAPTPGDSSSSSGASSSTTSSSGADARALWSSAYRALECAVQLEPSSAATWASVGLLMTHLQQHHDALDALSRALRANSRDPALWCSVGGLYDMKQQWRDAREAYQQAIAVAKLVEALPPALAVERLAILANYS